MYVYMCVYIYVTTCMHVYVCTCTYVYMYVSVYVRLQNMKLCILCIHTSVIDTSHFAFKFSIVL